jgi:hypothetical protein
MNMPVDQLAERLRELPLEEPRPDAITARVLAAAKGPAPRRGIARTGRPLRRPAFVAIPAAFLILVLGLWGALYFSPATAAALADASGPGGFSGEILDHVGLGSGNITAESSSSTSSGYRLQLVGAYADSIRTVVLIKMSPAAFISGTPQLTDQFGTSYFPQSGQGNLETGDQVLSFEPASWLASATGMRFTLTVNQVELLGGQQQVTGSWTVRGVVLLDTGKTIRTPRPGSLGPGTVTFVDAKYVGRSVSIKAEVRGVSLGGIVPATGPDAKPQPALSIMLIPDRGLGKPASSLSMSSDGNVTQLQVLFLNVDPGLYFLVITLEGVGTLDSALDVR